MKSQGHHDEGLIAWLIQRLWSWWALLAWSSSPLLVLATERVCLFAAEWLTLLTFEPPEITFTVLVCYDGSGGVTSLSTWFCCSLCCNTLLPLSVRRSFKWLHLRSLTTSNLRVMQSSILCPWSSWKSHHFEECLLSLGATIFQGHLIVLPVFLNTITSFVWEILRLYSGTLRFSCVCGGRSRERQVSLLRSSSRWRSR